MNLHWAVRAALTESGIEAKLAATDRLWADWQAGLLVPEPHDEAQPLTEAGRPERPELLPPKAMPRRDLNGPAGHRALIHALCHIEFTAINLALDAVYRFQGLPDAFYADWLKVASEEVLHFRLLRAHLHTLGCDYGDLPAHGGLWETAMLTGHDPLARMAVIPRYFEARGLDVTPGIQAKLRGYGDPAGAGILDIVLRDEIGHVGAGDRWFRTLCDQRSLEPTAEWCRQIEAAGLPSPRGPFNEVARAQAGFPIGEISAH
ncbi:MAG: ferritin-like domain-containing protein [Hydrogenophilaceae bacterium]